MSTRPAVPPAEVVVAHHAESLQRRRSARRMMWGILIGFVLLLMLTPFVLYLAWQARGRSLLRAELAAIKAKGEPVTTAEMAKAYAIPAGRRDITPIWMAAIAPFDTPAYTSSGTHLPIVGTSATNLPETLDEPLPDEQAIRDFFQLHQNKLAAVYAAAREDGEVRYPRDFKQGIALLLPEAQQIRSVVRTLDLEFELLAREKDASAAIENLKTQVAAGETLREEPLLISMLVRIAVHSVTLENIRQLAATNRLNDEQLSQLQQLVGQVSIHDQLPKAMTGERVWCFHAFHQNVGFVPNPNFSDAQNVPLETSHDVSGVKRPEDCAMALSMLGEMVDVSREPPHVALGSTAEFEAKMRDLHGTGPSLNRLRYAMTAMLLPAMQACATADARGEAMHRLTDASLAVRRFHLKHGRAPLSLAELVPDFLPAVPIDSHDGQPLRMKPSELGVLLYSVGKDQRDDGGVFDSKSFEPDIAVEVNLPQ